jgi:hypothetical protein
MTRRPELVDARTAEDDEWWSALLFDEVDHDRTPDEWVRFRLDSDGDVDASDRSEYQESEVGEEATKAAAAAAAADEEEDRGGDRTPGVMGSLDPDVSSDANLISNDGMVRE